MMADVIRAGGMGQHKDKLGSPSTGSEDGNEQDGGHHGGGGGGQVVGLVFGFLLRVGVRG